MAKSLVLEMFLLCLVDQVDLFVCCFICVGMFVCSVYGFSKAWPASQAELSASMHSLRSEHQEEHLKLYWF